MDWNKSRNFGNLCVGVDNGKSNSKIKIKCN